MIDTHYSLQKVKLYVIPFIQHSQNDRMLELEDRVVVAGMRDSGRRL